MCVRYDLGLGVDGARCDSAMSEFKGRIENKRDRRKANLVPGWTQNVDFVALWERIQAKTPSVTAPPTKPQTWVGLRPNRSSGNQDIRIDGGMTKISSVSI